MFSRAALEGIAAALRGHDCLIVSDDIYEKLLYAGQFLNIANVAPDLVPRLVVVNGMSKAYSMTGWRLGYAAGPKPLIAGHADDPGPVDVQPLVHRAEGGRWRR